MGPDSPDLPPQVLHSKLKTQPFRKSNPISTRLLCFPRYFHLEHNLPWPSDTLDLTLRL